MQSRRQHIIWTRRQRRQDRPHAGHSSGPYCITEGSISSRRRRKSSLCVPGGHQTGPAVSRSSLPGAPR